MRYLTIIISLSILLMSCSKQGTNETSEQDVKFLSAIKSNLKVKGDIIAVKNIHPGEWQEVCFHPLEAGSYIPQTVKDWEDYKLKGIKIINQPTRVSATDKMWGIYFKHRGKGLEYYRIPSTEIFPLINLDKLCLSKDVASFIAIGDYNHRNNKDLKSKLPKDFLEIELINFKKDKRTQPMAPLLDALKLAINVEETGETINLSMSDFQNGLDKEKYYFTEDTWKNYLYYIEEMRPDLGIKIAEYNHYNNPEHPDKTKAVFGICRDRIQINSWQSSGLNRNKIEVSGNTQYGTTYGSEEINVCLGSFTLTIIIEGNPNDEEGFKFSSWDIDIEKPPKKAVKNQRRRAP
jgi:hypothetical protein